MTRRSDTGPFALIPEWVLDLPISDRAVRLYAVLARYADNGNGEAWPSRRTLWERVRCSERSLDSAVKELVAFGALEYRQRWREDGSHGSNLWIIMRIQPGVGQETYPPGLRNVPTGGAGNAGITRTIELEPLNERFVRSYPQVCPVCFMAELACECPALKET